MLLRARLLWILGVAALACAHGCVQGGAPGDAAGLDAGGVDGPVGWCPVLATCDDGDPCTDGDLCAGGICVGMPRVCETPPGQCFRSEGACAEGACVYPTREGACDDGDACTIADRCDDGMCAGRPLTCQAPPRSRCLDASTLQVFVESGRCAEGRCIYTPVDRVCAGGSCLRDACLCEPVPPRSTVVATGLGPGGALDPALLVVGDALHLSFHDPVTRTLRYAVQQTGGGWLEEDVDPRPDRGRASALAAHGERLYLTYEDAAGGGVWLATRDLLGWSRAALPLGSGQVGAAPHVAVTGDNAVHVAVGSSAAGADARKLAYLRYRDDAWTVEDLASQTGTVAEPSLWLADGVQVVYREEGSGELRTLRRSGDGWASTALGGQVSAHVAAVDGAGGLHVVYRASSGGWSYARRAPGAPWVVESLPPNVEVGEDLSLWAAPGGEVHLASRVPRASVVTYRYAFRAATGGWSDREVAAFEASGRGTAIGVDSGGHAHIAMHDGSSGVLQVVSLRVCE